MVDREEMTKLINPTSKVIYTSPLIEVVCTGGWYDVYLNGQHYTGTMHLSKATEIFMGFNPK